MAVNLGLEFVSSVATGGVAHKLDTEFAFAGGTLLSIRNQGTEKWAVDHAGVATAVGGFRGDTVAERTADAGVTIDGVLLKDGSVAAAAVTEAAVTQHQGALSVVWGQLTGVPGTFPPAAHTHPSGEVTDFAEAVDDRVAAMLVAGAALGAVYDDGAGTLTLSVTDLRDAQVAGDAAIGWAKISKAGSSLADLATRSASDLIAGTLPDARLSNNVPLLDGSGNLVLGGTLEIQRFAADLYFTEADQTDPTGRWRIRANGGAWTVQRATAAEWASSSTVISLAGDKVTLAGDLDAGGDLTLGGYILPGLDPTPGPGRIYRDSTLGLALYGYAASARSWTLLNSAGQGVLYNPVGTRDVVVAGALTVGNGQVLVDGQATDSAPALAFDNDTNNGLYRYGENILGVVGGLFVKSGDLQVSLGNLQVAGNPGFNGQLPSTPQTYTPTNVVSSRSFDADTVSLTDLADVVGTLIADLQTVGLAA